MLGVLGSGLIEQLVDDGSGSYSRWDAFAQSLTDFGWSGGFALVAGTFNLAFVLWRRRELVAALCFAVAGWGLAFVYMAAGLYVWLLLHPGALS